MTPLPPSAASAEHLTDVLRRNGALGSGRVSAVSVDRTFPTILSLVQRLRLTYEGASPDAPTSLIFKTDLPNRPGANWESGRKEVAFYTDVAPATPAGLLLRCFEAHHDTASGAWHLLLEDLTDSHAVATQWPLPPTIEQSEAIVRVHARFQAAWWDDPRLGVTCTEGCRELADRTSPRLTRSSQTCWVTAFRQSGALSMIGCSTRRHACSSAIVLVAT